MARRKNEKLAITEAHRELSNAFEELQRLEGESLRAYVAFLDYVRMGDGRSISLLLRSYRERIENGAPLESVPTLRKATLAQWSTQHCWQKRLAAYINRLAQEEQADWEHRRREVRREDWNIGQRLRELALAILEQAPDFVRTTTRVVPGKNGEPDREVVTVALNADLALRAARTASDLQRRAAEMPPPTARVEHSGELKVYSELERELARLGLSVEDVLQELVRLTREGEEDSGSDDGDGDFDAKRPGYTGVTMM